MRQQICELLRPLPFYGKSRLLHAICTKEGEVSSKLFGYDVVLDLSDYIQRSAYLRVFESWETTNVCRFLKPGMTFVDVGANIGYFTLLAASLVGKQGKVIAFEPSLYAASRLAQTIEQNNLTQVHLVQAGLGDTEGELQLYVQPKEVGNHTPTMIAVDEWTPVRVPVYRLDDFLSEHQIAQIDFLKIDVEGFEPNVFMGAERILGSGKIKAILCEFNAYWLSANGSSPQQLYQMLREVGYVSQNKFNPKVDLQNLFFLLDAKSRHKMEEK